MDYNQQILAARRKIEIITQQWSLKNVNSKENKEAFNLKMKIGKEKSHNQRLEQTFLPNRTKKLL